MNLPIDADLFLLPPAHSDVPRLIELLKDKEIYDNTLEIPFPYTKQNGDTFVQLAANMLRRFGRPMIWAIHRQGEGVIGMIGFKIITKGKSRIEIGYWLGKAWWNQGITTRALQKVTQIAFDYGFKRVEMLIFKTNDASCRVAEKAGFMFEKLVPGPHKGEGVPIDAKLYTRDKPLAASTPAP